MAADTGFDLALVEEQLDVLEILQSMYPAPELTLLPETLDVIANLRPDPSSAVGLEDFKCTLTLPYNGDDSLELQITLPLSGGANAVIRHPAWMSRAEYQKLVWRLPEGVDDPAEVVEWLLRLVEHVEAYLTVLATESPPPSAEKKAGEEVLAGSLERVWFWFPSLSSKEKRKDLVEYAQSSDLTGFVLAGKPGLLCVEGDGKEIDRYMARIKSESWSDIPSYQKKVTERYRLPLADASDRKFSGMEDITDRIPKYGQYNHRGKMGEVKRLMEEWGVGDDFGVVVLQTGS